MTDTPGKDPRALFDESLAACGTPEPGPALTEAQDALISERLPSGMVDMLRSHGLCSFKKRRFQYLDPLAFVPLVERLFQGDPEIDPADVCVCAAEAFGILKLWSRKHFVMTLDLNKMQLTATEIAKPEFTGPAHLMAILNRPPDPKAAHPDNRARSLLPFEPENIDFYDPMNKPLFKSAVSAFGALEPGEIFGFSPPLVTLNGAIPRNPLERMQRQPAEQALAAAMEAAPLTLVRSAKGRIEAVRPIGAQ